MCEVTLRFVCFERCCQRADFGRGASLSTSDVQFHEGCKLVQHVQPHGHGLVVMRHVVVRCAICRCWWGGRGEFHVGFGMFVFNGWGLRSICNRDRTPRQRCRTHVLCVSVRPRAFRTVFLSVLFGVVVGHMLLVVLFVVSVLAWWRDCLIIWPQLATYKLDSVPELFGVAGC